MAVGIVTHRYVCAKYNARYVFPIPLLLPLRLPSAPILQFLAHFYFLYMLPFPIFDFPSEFDVKARVIDQKCFLYS
jgi:hypothetical protein